LVAILLQALQEYPALAASLPGNPGIWVDGLGLVSRVSIIAVAAYTLYSGIDFARANWHILRLDKTS
ncbi:MAG: hypothetical protein IT368_08740, partial [Candidatus Hydrogenedentes bacterium]|nr:hypothetical protein [Candidatus Hydrogenedentota bacterium]